MARVSATPDFFLPLRSACLLVLALLANADETEWRIRRLALAPLEHRSELEEALVDERWEERALALDALARSPRTARLGLEVFSVERCLSDAHGNVRAAALLVYAAAGQAPPDLGLEADTHPAVRHALIEALGRSDLEGRGADILLDLALQGGAPAEPAATALASAGPEAWAAQAQLFAGKVDLLLLHLPDLRKAPVSPALVTYLREHAQGDRERTLVEALALHGELDGAQIVCDREVLVAGWLRFDGGDYATTSRLRSRLIETAAEGDRLLGERLVAAAIEWFALEEPPDYIVDEFFDGPGAAAFLLECAAHALTPSAAIEAAGELNEPLAFELWSHIFEDAESIAPAAVKRWLEPEVDHELRFGVANYLSTQRSPVARDCLATLLTDGDSVLRRAAFRWYASGPLDAAGWARLFDAWSSYEPDEQREHLRSLPRGVPAVTFREALLELCENPEERTRGQLELLGAFRNDPQVKATLERWLEEALVELEGTTTLDGWFSAVARGEALVRALGSSAVEPIAQALRRSLAVPPPEETELTRYVELNKHAAALLGESASGREVLRGFLGDEVERRTRIEAGIQLLVEAEPEDVRLLAGARMRADLDGADEALGSRMVAALEQDPEGSAFLGDVLEDEARRMTLRTAALGALEARGAVEELRSALVAVQRADLVPEVAQSLVRLGDGPGSDAVIELWRRKSEEFRRGSEDPRVEHLVRELGVQVQLTGRLTEVEEQVAFAAPMRASVGDWRLRLRGEKGAAIPFRYDPELRIARQAARAGSLQVRLTDLGPWYRMDGELLAHLAQVALEAERPAVAATLAEAARVATWGEPLSDGIWNRRARIDLFTWQLHGLRGDREAQQAYAAYLWGDMRMVKRRIAAREDALGVFDRRRGVDPAAFLDAAHR